MNKSYKLPCKKKSGKSPLPPSLSAFKPNQEKENYSLGMMLQKM